MPVSRLFSVSRQFRIRRFIRLGSLTLALAASLLSAVPAEAVFLSWTAAAGGNASSSFNWNPAQTPTVADQLLFGLSNTYTVTFGSVADSVRSHEYNFGDVSLDMVQPHVSTHGFQVGARPADLATVRLTNGTITSGGYHGIGVQGNAEGTFAVTGGSSDFLESATGTNHMLEIGANSIGLLRVSDGGRYDALRTVRIGTGTGNGTLRVRGQSNVAPIRKSRFLADSSGAIVQVGIGGAHGTLEVQDGGLARIGRYLWLSTGGTADSSVVTISGGNSLDSARLVVNGDLLASFNPDGAVGGGVSNITVDSAGVLSVADSLVIGDPQGSDGRLTLKDGGRVITKHLSLQQPTGSPVDLQGGLLQVQAGTLSTFTRRLAVPGAADTARIELSNGASAVLVDTAGLPPLNLGSTLNATLALMGGSTMSANGAPPEIGNAAGSRSSLVVRGGSQFSSDFRLKLGGGGDGFLIMNGGSVVTSNGADLGPSATGYGYVDMEGAGTTLNLSGPLNVGGTLTSDLGLGGLIVRDDATVHLTAPLVAGNIWPGNTVSVSPGAVVNMTGVLTNRGSLSLSGGRVAGGIVHLRDAGRISGQGFVESGINTFPADTTTSLQLTGALSIGRDAPTGHVLFRGLAVMGSEVLQITDPDSAVLGRVSMGGGSLKLPIGGGVIEAGGRLFGTGSVAGDLTLRGFTQSIGAAGISFFHTVRGPGQGMWGDLFRFRPGSAFEGGGLVDASVRVDTGAVVRATSNLTLGLGAVVNSLTLDGRVETGPWSVLLRNGNDVNVGGELVVGGGQTLLGGGASLLNVTSTGRVTGRGTVNSPLTVGGRIEPGFSAGRLRVGGPFTLANSGVYVAELGDHAVLESDTVSCAGNATLFGALDVRLLPSFAAAAGDSFRVLECGALAGTFSSVTLHGQPAAGWISVTYRANGVWVKVLQNALGVEDGPRPDASVNTLRFSPVGSPGTNVAVELALPAATTARVRVYDVSGREVAAPYTGVLAAGRHRFELSRMLAGAGMYFARAEIGDGAERIVRTVRIVHTR